MYASQPSVLVTPWGILNSLLSYALSLWFPFAVC